jgi:hypothetical protein
LGIRIAIFFSRLLSSRFGVYRKGINFLEEYAKASKAESNKNKAGSLIVLYSVVILACAGVFFAYYIQIRQLDNETALIEPNINREEEERLNGELAAAMSAIELYSELDRLFQLDFHAYEETEALSGYELAAFYTVAEQSGVVIRAAAYNQDGDSIELDCVSPTQLIPSQFIKALKRSFNLKDGDIIYSGYSPEREGFRFSLICKVHGGNGGEE